MNLSVHPSKYLLTAAAVFATWLPCPVNAAKPPKLGELAPDFELKTPDDQSVRLSELTRKGNVVLIVLRGWPGYQCPVCTLQVQDYIRASPGLAQANARVVMVYPGPADKLKEHANEFLQDKSWPKEFMLLVDPDYTMVNAYGLRWSAPNETAYPSTFVLDQTGMVRFARVSGSHWNRTKASGILPMVQQLSKL
jgi:peroxiredoxin Q/BCP